MAEHDGCKGCAYVSRGEHEVPCVKCAQNASGNYKRMTNADRIRSMSDDELAELLYSIQNLEDKVKFCKNKIECDNILDSGKEIPDNMCKQCLVDWLQSEVEVDNFD